MHKNGEVQGTRISRKPLFSLGAQVKLWQFLLYNRLFEIYVHMPVSYERMGHATSPVSMIYVMPRP
ncbi:hypothetical protein GCM10025791_50040 [Halioxenophilus aromaticivorans]|uniref:Uncharacterized protein n=1 Tax=Halioxenophilus aromaticivorans TaxID=1306992 RepID=A0AAV3UB44_9ALTE